MYSTVDMEIGKLYKIFNSAWGGECVSYMFSPLHTCCSRPLSGPPSGAAPHPWQQSEAFPLPPGFPEALINSSCLRGWHQVNSQDKSLPLPTQHRLLSECGLFMARGHNGVNFFQKWIG